MSLRALGSRLTRRFSPRRILPRAQAETATPGSAAGRPPRYPRALRDFAAGDDNGARGALAVVGGLAAFAGILYFIKFKKDTADSQSQVAGTEKARKNEVAGTVSGGDIIHDEAIRATFMNKDGSFAWLEYIDYMNFRRSNPEVTDPEVLDEMLRMRYDAADKEVEHQEDDDDVRVDESEMKARFEDWMRKYDKTYEREEEKARRYEIFKRNAIKADKANASSPRDELYGSRSRHTHGMYAEGRVDGVPGTVEVHEEVECTEAVKRYYGKLRARKAKQDTDARKSKQTTDVDNL